MPERDELRTPMALIDGIIPDLNTILSAYELHNQSGLPQYAHESHSAFYVFESLNVLANSLEGKMSKGHPEKYGGHTLDNLHQYLIYHEAVVKDESSNSFTLSGNVSFEKVGSLLKGVSNSHYCINVFADPHNSNPDRLKRYLFHWLSITQFKPLKENNYSNYVKFDKLYDTIFRRIDDIYTDPIGASLIGIINAENSKFKGVRINP